MKQFKKITQARGQGMTEYIIIVALIAVAAIGVYSQFGDVIKGQTAQMANQMAGKDSTAGTQAANAAANAAGTAAATKKNLGTYATENKY